MIRLRYEALAEIDSDALTVRLLGLAALNEQRDAAECPSAYSAAVRLLASASTLLVLPPTLPPARRALELEYLRQVDGLTREQAGLQLGLTLRQARSLHDRYRGERC